MKIQFAGRTVEAHLQTAPGDHRWLIRVGPVILTPVSVARLRARLNDATDLERSRLTRSGYEWHPDVPTR